VDECPFGYFISGAQNEDAFSLSQNQCQGTFLLLFIFT